MGLGWCGTSTLLWVNGGGPSTRLRTGSTSVRPDRSGAESKGWGWVGAVLRLCFGSTGGPFDAAQDRPFDAAQDRPFDAAQDRLSRPFALSGVERSRRVGVGLVAVLRLCFGSTGEALRRGSGQALTSVRPERSGAESKGWGGAWCGPSALLWVNAGGPSTRLRTGPSTRLRTGFACSLGLASTFLRLRCTPLCSVPLRSGRTGGGLRSGPSTRLRMLGGAHRMRGGGCLPGGVGLRASFGCG